MNGKHDAAEENLVKLHRNSADPTHSFARKEYLLMKAQIDLEAESDQPLGKVLKNGSLRKRFIIGWLTMTATQSSGAIVILCKYILFRNDLYRNGWSSLRSAPRNALQS